VTIEHREFPAPKVDLDYGKATEFFQRILRYNMRQAKKEQRKAKCKKVCEWIFSLFWATLIITVLVIVPLLVVYNVVDGLREQETSQQEK